MEWSIFLITMGMLMAFCFIGIGVCIGAELVKRQLYKCDSGPILPCGDLDMDNSDVGDTNRAEHSGQDLGPDVPTKKEIRHVLWELSLKASDTEKRVIDYFMKQEEQDNE